MKGTELGELEEIVLLTIAALYDEAYSVAVLEEMERRMDRPISIGTVHRTMQRQEEKGLSGSRFEEATKGRGRRRKRLFTLTPAGERSLVEARDLRNELWCTTPKAAFNTSLP